MRSAVLALSSLALLGLALPAPADTTFALNGDNTKIQFVGSKVGGKHDGSFPKLVGKAVAGADPTSLKLVVVLDMTALETDNPKLTGHLKSPDFFGVATNPKARFVTTRVEREGRGYKVTGSLTLNGKTKAVTFPAAISTSEEALRLTSTFKINRHDWGISYGKGKIHDDVTLTVAVNARK
jgi:polyisoprenoid-binding protein YceI